MIDLKNLNLEVEFRLLTIKEKSFGLKVFIYLINSWEIATIDLAEVASAEKMFLPEVLGSVYNFVPFKRRSRIGRYRWR